MRFRHKLGVLTILVALTAPLMAQQPGDRVEYRVQRNPEKWEVGTVVRLLSGGKRVVVRTAPSTFFPNGHERAFATADIRAYNGDVAGPVIPPPKLNVPPPPKVSREPELPPDTVPKDLPACGPRPNPTNDRLECVQLVAQYSANWRLCQSGSEPACHRFVREVARALSIGDPRWGLISKPKGQHACTLRACGGYIEGGFGSDVVAYLPDGYADYQWLGADIIGGSGAFGARPQWLSYGGTAQNRRDNLWARLP